MGNYLPNTDEQRAEMLKVIGLESIGDLYDMVPEGLIQKGGPGIPEGKSEMEVSLAMKQIAAKNKVFGSVFRGAGAYRHYIPAIVGQVTGKESFLTSYTPYQAEISQGLLQSIFEYQTMICELTGMDVSNASVYDGASAAAEAVAMCRGRGRTKALVSETVHPDVIGTVRTYCRAAGFAMELIPSDGGITDLGVLEGMLDEDTACVLIAQPNYFGILEDASEAGELAHRFGAKFIMSVNPIAAAVLKTPMECGADIAVGEGQPLGMPLSFGGPWLGFMAATSALTRKLPGRIVGETTDAGGGRAFVLTLQAREQHIRRDKAGSNICSNQALCAMAAAVYMVAMGPGGMEAAANRSMSKAHYLADELGKVPEFGLKYQRGFFHEFVTECPPDMPAILEFLEARGILGGLLIEDGVLWCATEMNTKEEIDRLISFIKEARAEDVETGVRPR
ncbi:MAG: aminomethyl-transferring glycine dehydrogenase subunit GcvPA [Clostridiales bacterium]|nr:aminomethyl-transferring glycine dehydrogenase subunit GcvPA [Clostridiales bacterium]